MKYNATEILCKVQLEKITFSMFSGASDNEDINTINQLTRFPDPFSTTILYLVRQ